MSVPTLPKILVVRVGRAGDLVMITPALRVLLEGFPDAELHLLSTDVGPRVLGGYHPRLTRFHHYHRRFPGSLLIPSRLRKTLLAEGYARVYRFETDAHYRGLVADAAPEVFGLEEGGPLQHFSSRCLDVVERTLPRPLPRGWVALPVTEAGRVSASEHLAEAGLRPGDRLVGLHATFNDSSLSFFADRLGRKHREWPLETCAELASRLCAYGRERGLPLRPVLDVLPQERRFAAELKERAGDAVTVLSGPPDFERYKAVLERMSLLVSPNTGPMHIAAAVGTPVVALFSGWSPAECGPFVHPDRFRALRAEDMESPERGLAAIPAAAAFDACRPFLP